MDLSFHPQMAEALRIFVESETSINLTPLEIWELFDELEALPYEEWLSWFNDIKNQDFNRAKQLLLTIVKYHYESGWRFNALQLLEDNINEE